MKRKKMQLRKSLLPQRSQKKRALSAINLQDSLRYNIVGMDTTKIDKDI